MNTQKKIASLKSHDKSKGINEKFDNDPLRVDRFSYAHNELYIDFSKTHISRELVKLYVERAAELCLESKRKDLFSGKRINVSENRPVLHTLLRDATNHGITLDEPGALEEASISQEAFFSKVEQIQQSFKQRKDPVKHIIHVGIGGSSLGPQLVFEALKNIDNAINIHFVGNIDAHHLSAVLAMCEVENTIVIGVSKTFTTAETLHNIRTIRRWFKDAGRDIRENLYAVTRID